MLDIWRETWDLFFDSLFVHIFTYIIWTLQNCAHLWHSGTSYIKKNLPFSVNITSFQLTSTIKSESPKLKHQHDISGNHLSSSTCGFTFRLTLKKTVDGSEILLTSWYWEYPMISYWNSKKKKVVQNLLPSSSIINSTSLGTEVWPNSHQLPFEKNHRISCVFTSPLGVVMLTWKGSVWIPNSDVSHHYNPIAHPWDWHIYLHEWLISMVKIR